VKLHGFKHYKNLLTREIILLRDNSHTVKSYIANW